MLFDSVSISDWISLAVGIIGFISAYLSSKQRLPSWARKWLAQVGNVNVQAAIEKAAAVETLTPDQRRKQAVIYLQKLTIKSLGFPIPASIANLLIEYVYQQWKHMKRK